MWKRPALHFVLLGTALYLGELWLSSGANGEATGETISERVLTLTAARRDQLRHQWHRTTGRPPGPGEEEWLVRQWADDEMLYREALRMGLDEGDPGVCHRLALNLSFLAPEEIADDRDPRSLCRRARELGLDRGDPVIRRQMAEKMRLLLKSFPTAPAAPETAAVEAYIESHRERFAEPERLRLSHVFLSRSGRGEDLDSDARDLLARLTVETPAPHRAVDLGDPFLAGHHPPASSRRELGRGFGNEFADAVMSLPTRQWSQPIASAFGLHLVWVHERRAAKLEPSDEILRQATLELEAEMAERHLAQAMKDLRERWEVRVEPSRQG